MKSELTGHVALVTGGAVRLGRAMVERLAAEGCGVVIHCHRSRREADQLAADLRARGTAAAVVQGSLTTQTACARIIRTARRAHGRLDILVNSAAVFNRQGLAEITAKSLRDEFWPNLFGPVLLTQAFAAATRRGHVINILDRRIASHDATCIPYLLSKKALAAFTEVAALALAPRIRVNAVAPGPILPPPGKGARYLREHAGRLPLGRAPAVDEVAEAVVALVCSRSTTGQILFVDGGQHLLGNGV
jgi:NAD(P)-dependent dehydrogenase (short-subunit alcohol dehydrogenase family)